MNRLRLIELKLRYIKLECNALLGQLKTYYINDAMLEEIDKGLAEVHQTLITYNDRLELIQSNLQETEKNNIKLIEEKL